MVLPQYLFFFSSLWPKYTDKKNKKRDDPPGGLSSVYNVDVIGFNEFVPGNFK